MKFAVLTTTHMRPSLLMRAVGSVRSQTCTEYIHIIINDSPDYDYGEVEAGLAGDGKILYIKNQTNMGKNYSLNLALDYLGKNDFEGYVVYLDDDDWLTDTCLSDFEKSITNNPKTSWFVSNRILSDGKSLTINNTGKSLINYFTDYLLYKKFKGDATHCIDFLKTHKSDDATYYPKHIKNGEEWYYFTKVSKKCGAFLYIDKPGTISEGYSIDGLNTQIQKSYKENTRMLFKEKQTLQIFSYLILRVVSTFKKNKSYK